MFSEKTENPKETLRDTQNNEISSVAELATDLFGEDTYLVTRITRGEVNRVYSVKGSDGQLIFRLNVC